MTTAHQLVQDNIRLALNFGRERAYREHGQRTRDGYGAAFEGLARAAQLFDPSKGKFSTYAFLWMRHMWQDWIERNERWSTTHGGRFRDGLGLHVRRADPGPLDLAIRRDIRERVIRATTEVLSPRDAELVFRYFGFDGEPRSTIELGRMYGFSQQAAHQILRKSLLKIGARLGRDRRRSVRLRASYLEVRR